MGETLPKRQDFVVRSAHVLTCDPVIGDLPEADVYVRDGRIISVGTAPAVGVTELDGRGMIVLPGLVETHWHMWNTLYRSLAGSTPAHGYFALNPRLGPLFQPTDTYRGVRLALADALSSGLTTVHDWSHNISSPAHAEANLRAHTEVGLRGRFSYGPPQAVPADQTIDLADLERVHRDWFSPGSTGSEHAELLHLGLAGRPPGIAEPAVYRAEREAAHRLGIPISYHCASTRAHQQLGMIATMHAEGMLGPEVQLIHMGYTTTAERRLVAESGASVTISPWTEMMIGYGIPPVHDLITDDLLVNLSVDTVALSGTADMFSIMRVVINLAHGQAEQEFGLTARQVLNMATIDGARGLGLADVTGSLTPGKRGDLIMIRTDAPNIAPFTDAPLMAVLAAQPANVDTVVVDGRILKRHGQLTALHPAQVVAEANTALADLLARTPG